MRLYIYIIVVVNISISNRRFNNNQRQVCRFYHSVQFIDIFILDIKYCIIIRKLIADS